jgi:surface antigen
MGVYLKLFFNNLLRTNAMKRKRSPFLWIISVVMLVTMAFAPAANAATLNQQINNVEQHNSRTEKLKHQLGLEATSLSETIANLNSEISAIDGQIHTTQDKVGSLKQEITKAESDLSHQRKMLGNSIREMYIKNDISTIEMLASSKDFSHFVDQAQYREKLQKEVNSTTQRVKKLSSDLKTEKKSVDNLLADQQAMQKHVEQRRAESERLLNLNHTQQKTFQERLAVNQTKLAELRKQQAAENQKGQVGESGKGNQVSKMVAKPEPAPAPAPQKPAVPQAPHGSQYPWADVPFPNTVVDPWGMYKRQCVSYTAWKVAASGRHMPYWGGHGNAKLWDDNARRAGIPVDQNPRVGDVAISNAGKYGHSMYVEAVHGDGTITVSQYNAGWDGRYSEVRRSAAGLFFIHF